jgi:hypothetical protein
MIILEQILQLEILAFDEIAERAIALEASKTYSHDLSKKSVTLMSANEEVNKIFKYQNTRCNDGNAQKGTVLPRDPELTSKIWY